MTKERTKEWYMEFFKHEDKDSSELESLDEMQEIMEEAPNYTISVEGRK